MKKAKKRLIKAMLVFILSLMIMLFSVYNYELSPVSKSTKTVEFTIEAGTSKKDIAIMLEKKKLIRSSTFFMVYLKLNNINNLYASTYTLSYNMGVKEIIDVLSNKNSYNPDSLTLTFPEGINMRKVAKIISNNTNNSYDDVINKANDTTYLKEKIEEYWFLSEDILDTKIYYKLEGYLYPDTYEFKNKDVDVETIFDTMLKQTNEVLKTYQKQIEKNKYSTHQLLTLASMVELEGSTLEYRKSIAGVFYNRLDEKMNLGSDVTTYYAFKIEMNERDLTSKELNTYNAYNTRGPNMMGKIPIGPICNVSSDSIEAVLNPTKHDYYYFVADKNGKVYFSKTSSEHEKTIKEIKENGDWIQW